MGRPLNVLALLLAGAGLAGAQLQAGRVSTDYRGGTILMESTAALAGEGRWTGERILEWTEGQIAITAAGVPGAWQSGVIRPMTNDHGHLRAYSYWERSPSGGPASGSPGAPRYVGVVRHVDDGWEVRRDGLVELSREGRWAVFTDNLRIRTVWLDLWLDEEFVVEGRAIFPARVADDGAVVWLEGERLIVQRPHAAPVEINLPFRASYAMMDRTGGWAAVNAGGGIHRVSLVSGTVEAWMAPCLGCSITDVSAHAAALMYLDSGTMVVVRQPGGGHQWLHRVKNAAFTGDGRAAMAQTSEGSARFEVETAVVEQILAGPVEVINPPGALSPGVWVRSRGGGLSGAWITVNGDPVHPEELRPDGLVWVAPSNLAAGVAAVRMGQRGSPFEPSLLELPVHAALPVFVTLEDAQSENASMTQAGLPYIRRAADGSEVTTLNRARPGDTIIVTMTGLNGLAASVRWSIEIDGVEFMPVFESSEPSGRNPHWTDVRLRLPEALPPAWLSLLLAEVDGVRNFAALPTRSD